MPTIFEHLFDGVDNPNKGLQGLFDSITIILVHLVSTPLFISSPSSKRGLVLAAGIMAVVLNLTLPQEFDEGEHDDDDDAELAEVESQKHKSG